MRSLFVIIVRNVSINIYNKRRKSSGISYEELGEELSDSEPSIEEILMNQETLSVVAEKVRELHPSYADILSLKLFYHYEDSEVCQILSITPENFRTRFHRAKKSLIKLLSQEREVANHE